MRVRLKKWSKAMLEIGARALTGLTKWIAKWKCGTKGNEVTDGSASRNLSKKSTANFSILKR